MKRSSPVLKLIITICCLLLLGAILSMFYLNSLLIDSPVSFSPVVEKLLIPKKLNDSTYTVGNNYLQRIDSGMYVLYLEGDALDRGNALGALTSDLHRQQELAFISQIKKMIPSPFYLKFLKYFIAYFTRDIEKYIPKEYLEEIYAESRYMSSDFDATIGPAYMRILNYHAAHDIGHALQDRHFVTGCTSFAAWGTYTTDNKLIIGRNFDFYVGDDFAKNKIICFMKPSTGIPFAMVTWPGMIGAVSGLNKSGITVTINAAKSSLPLEAKTPVSIVAREILQYASSLSEAISIARKRQMFVSESILVGSASENRAIIIEKSPDSLGVYSADSSLLICSNHFQSSTFSRDSNNIKFRDESSSDYRFLRMQQLIASQSIIDPLNTAGILRNPYGMDNEKIGWGNEKAIDQLIAHHSVIMKPATGDFWVSTHPYQLGKYLHFNMTVLFQSGTNPYQPSLNIPADTFLLHQAYLPYMKFKKLAQWVEEEMKSKKLIVSDSLSRLIHLNPDYYRSYEIAGDYFTVQNSFDKAKENYMISLQKVIPTLGDKDRILMKIQNLQHKK